MVDNGRSRGTTPAAHCSSPREPFYASVAKAAFRFICLEGALVAWEPKRNRLDRHHGLVLRREWEFSLVFARRPEHHGQSTRMRRVSFLHRGAHQLQGLGE